MNWTDFASACALMLVLEGLLPFLSPSVWRRIALMAMTMNDSSMRRWGLLLMIIGAGSLTLIKGQ